MCYFRIKTFIGIQLKHNRFSYHCSVQVTITFSRLLLKAKPCLFFITLIFDLKNSRNKALFYICTCWTLYKRKLRFPFEHMVYNSVGSALIWLSWIRICIGNAKPDPGAMKFTKIKNKSEFKPSKKAFYIHRFVLWHITYIKYIFHLN